MLIPVAVLPKAWVFAWCMLAGIVGTDLAGRHGCLSFVSVVFCQFSTTARSLVQRNPTECGVFECDLEISTLRRPWPTRAVELEKCVFKKLRFK
jgi:hypothetical protein